MATQQEIEKFISECGQVTLHVPDWGDIPYPQIQDYAPPAGQARTAKVVAINPSTGVWRGKLKVSSNWGATAQGILEGLEFDYDATNDCLYSTQAVAVQAPWVLQRVRIFRTQGNKMVDILDWRNANTTKHYVTAYIWPWTQHVNDDSCP